MEFDVAVQLIMVLIAAWTLYVTRRGSRSVSFKKKSTKASIACVRAILKKKPSVLSMLNVVGQKKSGNATGSSISSKKALELHILFSEKKVSIDTWRIASSKKVFRVNNCGQKNDVNIGMPINNLAFSGIPPKKAFRNPFLGLLKKSPPQTVFGWGDKKRLGLGVYA